jgi:hypothetical protein
MTAEEAPQKFPRALLEVLVALALLGLGLYGLSVALQQRPYLGNPASALAQVPLRVLAEPNIPIMPFYGIVGRGGRVQPVVLRLIHQIFFRPVVALACGVKPSLQRCS